MKKKIKTIYEEAIAIFSDENGLSQETATKILGVLYKKGKDAKKLDRLLLQMEMFLKKNEIPRLMEKMTTNQIGKIIDEMISEDDQMSVEVASDYSESMTVWGFYEMGSEFSDGKVFEAGDKVSIQIMRTGKWNHSMYGEINITAEVLANVKKNFDEQARGIDLAVDENHEPNHKALGWFRELTKKGKDSLFATIELTKKGAELLSEGAYKYFSPEIVFNKQDEESGQSIKNLLIGGAFTNRPFFKAMQPLLASERNGLIEAADRHQNIDGHSASDSNHILFFNTGNSMKEFLEIISIFGEKATINAEELASVEAAFSEVSADFRTTELLAAYDELKAKFSEEGEATDPAVADPVVADPADEPKIDEPASEEKKDGEAAADPAKADEPKIDKPASTSDPEKKIEANEKGEITIKASEYESLKQLASQTGKLVKEARKTQLEGQFSELCFSEKNPTSVVLPKFKKEIVDHALSLSEKQSEKFFEIIGKLQVISAGEIGSSADGSEAFSEENAEEIKFFTEKMGLNKEQAIEAIKSAKASVSK